MSVLSQRKGAVAAARRGGAMGTPVTFSPTIIPISNATEIANTGRGQYLWIDTPADPVGWPLRDVYYRDGWDSFESASGVYTNARMDQGLALAASMGGRFTFRVMSVNDSITYTPTRVALQSGTNIPDWNSSSFLTAYTNLMAHLGSLYNSDPRLAAVDMGGYGNYAEWHTGGIGGASLTMGSAQTIINAVVAAFPNKYVMMMTADAGFLQLGMNAGLNVGIRVDCFGEVGQAGTTVDQVPDALYRWHTAPYATEWCPFTTAPDYTALADQQVSDYHISLLSSVHMAPPYASMATADQASFAHANKTSGYRINLTSVVLPGTILRGTAFSLTSTWNNAGVAPPYNTWSATYQLRSGTTVVWTGTSTLGTKTLIPGATVFGDTFTVPTGVSPGTYSLAVKVVDPTATVSPMALAQSGVNADHSYALGSVTLT